MVGGGGVGGGVGGIPSNYLVSTQLQLLLLCCWGCGCCWAVTITNSALQQIGDECELARSLEIGRSFNLNMSVSNQWLETYK